MDVPLPVAFAALLLGAALLLTAAWSWRQRSRIADLPTSKVRSIAIGDVELKGTAQPAAGQAPLVTRFSGQPCLHWRYTLEEEHTRVVPQQVGKTTVMRTEHYWVTVGQQQQTQAIQLVDDTGGVLLDPAHVTPPTPARASWSSPNWSGFPNPAIAQALSGPLPRRLMEAWTPVGMPLYVLGSAQRLPGSMAQGPDALMITKPEHGSFILTDQTEEHLLRRDGAATWLALSAGLVLVGLGAYALTGGL